MNEISAQKPGSRPGISPRIAEAVAADLRQRILRNGKTGEPLPRQEDLIHHYGVSGPSLREALRILEAEGLITVRRGMQGGADVHIPNWSSAAFALALSMQGQGVKLADLAESVLQLEPICAGACAQREDRAESIVPELRANLEETERLIGNGEQYSATARIFHETIVTGMPSDSMRLLVRTIVAIWSIQENTWAARAQAAHQYPDEEAQRHSYAAHAALLELIEAGDVKEATDLSARHIRATQAIVLDRFGDVVVDSASLAAVQAFKSL